MDETQAHWILFELSESKSVDPDEVAYAHVPSGLMRDVLVAYRKFYRQSSGHHRHQQAHQCSVACHPLFQYNDVYICFASGNMHICNFYHCQFKVGGEHEEGEFCQLTCKRHAQNLVSECYDRNGDATESNMETDFKQQRSGEDAHVVFGEYFEMHLPSVYPVASAPPLLLQKEKAIKQEAQLSEPWGTPQLRAIKKTRVRSRSGGGHPPPNKRHKPSTNKYGVEMVSFKNVKIKRTDKKTPMTDATLQALGQSEFLRIFQWLNIPVQQEFISWIVRLAIILLIDVETHPLSRKRRITYSFAEHLRVVMLEMSCGLSVSGFPIIPRCDFVRRHIPTTRDITRYGQVPRVRNETQKHLKAVLTLDGRTGLKELSDRIAALGVYTGN